MIATPREVDPPRVPSPLFGRPVRAPSGPCRGTPSETATRVAKCPRSQRHRRQPDHPAGTWAHGPGTGRDTRRPSSASPTGRAGPDHSDHRGAPTPQCRVDARSAVWVSGGRGSGGSPPRAGRRRSLRQSARCPPTGSAVEPVTARRESVRASRRDHRSTRREQSGTRTRWPGVRAGSESRSLR